MPDSETPLEWYPPGWTEAIHENYIEWAYEADPTINVRIVLNEDESGFTVWATAGVNTDGEEMRFRPVKGLSERDVFQVAFTLFSAMNGVIRRINGDPEFKIALS